MDTADEGEISVAGEEVTGRSEDDLARLRRRHIGLVFQFFNLLEGMTVLENVALPGRSPAQAQDGRDPGRLTCSDLLGIGDKARAVPGVLSVGSASGWRNRTCAANEPTLSLATSRPVVAPQGRGKR